jgi:hypothetical protein
MEIQRNYLYESCILKDCEYSPLHESCNKVLVVVFDLFEEGKNNKEKEYLVAPLVYYNNENKTTNIENLVSINIKQHEYKHNNNFESTTLYLKPEMTKIVTENQIKNPITSLDGEIRGLNENQIITCHHKLDQVLDFIPTNIEERFRL